MINARRPIKARGAQWARGLAAKLAQKGITPNQISVLSAVFSLFSMVLFIHPFFLNFISHVLSLVLAALFIQLRLICNLMDGMVAVEHKQQTKSGEVFNDAPDRFADMFILIGAGYAVSGKAFGIELGYLAAGIAVFTAYVRVLGASMGVGHYFLGPMAKQHRMALLTVASLLEAFFLNRLGFSFLYIALCIVVVGGTITVLRRLTKIVNEIES